MAADQSTYDAFNPQVNVAAPGGVPNFKPAGEGMSFKSSLGEALKGLGDLVGTVTSGVDAIIKSNIEGDRQAVATERDKQISDLEATYGTQAVSQLLRPGELSPAMRGAGAPRTAPTDTMSGPQFPPPEFSETMTPGGQLVGQDKPLPKDINDLPGRANALYNARNDGHISDTYYWGRLADIASDIRSRYPRGYRDYIDNKIQAITGRDPANAYIESLIKDINSNLGDKNKNMDKLLAEFYQGNLVGRPGVTQMIKGLTSGRISYDTGVDFLGALKQEDAKNETALKQYNERKAAGEDAAHSAAVYASTRAPTIVNEYFRGMSTVNGEGVLDISTPEALNRVASEYRQGKRQLSEQVANTLATQVGAWIQAADKAIDEDFQKNGVYRDMANDPEKIKQIKALHLEPLVQLQKAFSTKDLSAAASIKNTVDAVHNDFNLKMVNDKDLGHFGLSLRWLKENVGDQGAAAVLVRQEFQGLLNGFSQKGKAIAAQLMTPDNVYNTLLGAKDYTSLTSAITAIREGAAENGYKVDSPQVKKTYAQLFKDIEDTLAGKDIKPETRQALVKSIFGPDNFNVLREIAPDKKDPYNPNIVVPGYQSLFYRLTQQDIAKNVHDLGPAYEKMYLNWVQTAVRTDLFGRDLVRLNEILTRSGGMNESLYSLNWNTNTKNFEVKVKPVSQEDTTSGRYRFERMSDDKNIRDTVASLNKGLSGMANAAVGLGRSGTDVDGFVLEQLVAAGVTSLDQIGQMPSKVRMAIQNAYAVEAFNKAQGEIRRTKQDELYTNPTFRGDHAVPAPAPTNAVKTESIRPTPVMTRGRPSPMPPAELGPGE